MLHLVSPETLQHYEPVGVVDTHAVGLRGRFVLPTDELILRTYKMITSSIVDGMDGGLPVTGVAAFGSTVKGAAHVESCDSSPRSDVDITVFIDAGKDGLGLKLEGGDGPKTRNDWSAFESNIEAMRGRRKSLVLGGALLEHSKAQGLLAVNADILPISDDYIRALTDPQYAKNSLLPYRLFQLAITDGLQPYRQQFLSTMLRRHDTRGAWGAFRTGLKDFVQSRKTRPQTELYYPKTLREMMKLYRQG